MKLTRAIIAILILAMVAGLSGCATTNPPEAPTPTPIPTTVASITADEAKFLVLERVQGMARTIEAKEYVAILFSPSFFSEWPQEPEGGWRVELETVEERFQREPISKLARAEWFFGDADRHFALLQDSEWRVFDTGKIIPMSGAIMLEASIERLNNTRMLK